MKKFVFTVTALLVLLLICSIAFAAPAKNHSGKADATPVAVVAEDTQTPTPAAQELKADATVTADKSDILNIQNVPDSNTVMPDDSIDTEVEIEAAGTTASMKSSTPVPNDKFEEPQVEAKDNTIPPSVPDVKK
jgi:hypothetical protein